MERKGAFHLTVAVCILMAALSQVTHAQYGGGSGTADDPYQIYTAQDLVDLGKTPDHYDRYFILMADIDLSDHTFDRALIAPFIDSLQSNSRTTFFTGVFDGNGHVVRNLHIEGSSYLGLFGYIGHSAVIFDLGLEGGSVESTGDYVGGLAAWNQGVVLRCHWTGAIVGARRYVGGLVGNNRGVIVNCYGIGAVEGRYRVGGLVGDSGGRLWNCYSTGAAAGVHYVGGLVGMNGGSVWNSYSRTSATCVGAWAGGLIGFYSSTGVNCSTMVSNCYSTGVVVAVGEAGGLIAGGLSRNVVDCFWDRETSGVTISAGGTGVTTAELQNVDLLLATGWDFVDERANGTAETWQMPQTGGYPVLSLLEGYEPVLPEGQGTLSEPFLITNPMELGGIWFRPLASYRLEADIDLSGITWATAVVPWFPGCFDGNGHVIRHLHIQGAGLLGLFGHLDNGSLVVDLGLEYGSVAGSGSPVGALAGRSAATIANCYSDGVCTRGRWQVGGLIGSNSGSMSGCHSTGAVSGNDGVGGLIGHNGGNLWGCHSTGAVTGLGGETYCIGGWRGVGGLVGYNSGASILNCHSTGAVVGDHLVGGLIGFDYRGTISHCYSTGAVAGNNDVGGLVGCRGNLGCVWQSYATGKVMGNDSVGGLIGANNDRVANCYSRGAVTGSGGVGGLIGRSRGSIATCYSTGAVKGENDVGGLVGHHSGAVTRSFWNTESSGVSGSSGGVGLTTAEMMDPQWIGLQGWANDPNWVLDVHQDYPRLAWEGMPGRVVPEPAVDWEAGQGTPERPYEIDDPNQLLTIGKASLLWNRSYVLTGSLDLEGITWNQAVIPNFAGTFDGAGYTITNLRVSGGHYLGFIGCLEKEGAVANLGLSDVHITGDGNDVGGLVGDSHGRVSSCYVTGLVLAGNRVGGAIGANHGKVYSCFSAGVVSAGNYVGGLIGMNDVGGSVSNCYSLCAATGRDCVGGLIGYEYTGDTMNCYAAGAVTGVRAVGGFAGYKGRVNIADSFWDLEASGQETSRGGTGLTTADMMTAAPFLEAGWDFVGEEENGTEDIWWIDEGRDYPRLWWEEADAEF